MHYAMVQFYCEIKHGECPIAHELTTQLFPVQCQQSGAARECQCAGVCFTKQNKQPPGAESSVSQCGDLSAALLCLVLAIVWLALMYHVCVMLATRMCIFMYYN